MQRHTNGKRGNIGKELPGFSIHQEVGLTLVTMRSDVRKGHTASREGVEWSLLPISVVQKLAAIA